MRPNTLTTFATYSALSLAGGVSFFMPMQVLDNGDLVLEPIAPITAAVEPATAPNLAAAEPERTAPPLGGRNPPLDDELAAELPVH